MTHNPEAIVFSWVLLTLIVVLAIVVIKDLKGMSFKHDLSDSHCNHSALDRETKK